MQAGSYALMDTAYAKLGLPFRAGPQRARPPSCRSTPDGGRCADAGLKASAWTTATRRSRARTVWFCSDEHLTFDPREHGAAPASATGCGCCPPTSTRPWRCTSGLLVDGDDVLEVWPIDLRGW